MNSRIPASVAAIALALLLFGCTGQPAPTPSESENYVSDTADASDPEVTPNPIEPDTTLIVRATATAENGAQLSLELQIHQAVRWDDVAGQTLPKALIEDCGGALTAELFASESWSFTRGNITAIPTAASKADWPTEARIDLLPSASAVYTAGRGVLAHEDEASALPICQRAKFFTSAGRGGFALGIPSDAGSFTGWANHRFGFGTSASDVSLSECSIELTPLGSSLNGGAGWAESQTTTFCATGAATESSEY